MKYYDELRKGELLGKLVVIGFLVGYGVAWFCWLVPRGGLEPPRGFPRRILSPLRLPFRHLGVDFDIQPHLTCVVQCFI